MLGIRYRNASSAARGSAGIRRASRSFEQTAGLPPGNDSSRNEVPKVLGRILENVLPRSILIANPLMGGLVTLVWYD